MGVSLSDKIKKLENRSSGNIDSDDIRFNVFLIKESSKKPGTFLRKRLGDDKYTRLSPDELKQLGIEPYNKSVERPQAVIKEPPVRIAVPATKDALNADIEENPEKRIERIRSAIYRDFNHD